jgi:hypothetical protein
MARGGPAKGRNTEEAEARLGLDGLGGKLRRISSRLLRNHEHVSVKFTPAQCREYGIENEYGGITGTLNPGAFERIARFLAGCAEPVTLLHRRGGADEIRLQARRLAPEFRLEAGVSVMCDVGSGTGRPSFYFGCLPLRASFGVDIDPMLVYGSCHSLRGVERDLPGMLRAPVCFHHGDVTKLASFGPSTHLFGFMGYPTLVKATVLLAARSAEVKVLVAVVLQKRELDGCGVLDEDLDLMADPEASVMVLPSLSMPSGRSYLGLVIPMTAQRKARVLSVMRDEETAFRKAQSDNSLAEVVQTALAKPGGFAALLERQLETQFAVSEGRPRRAVVKRAAAKAAEAKEQGRARKQAQAQAEAQAQEQEQEPPNKRRRV